MNEKCLNVLDLALLLLLKNLGRKQDMYMRSKKLGIKRKMNE